MTVFAVDCGGTNLAIGVNAGPLRPMESGSVSTPQEADAVPDAIIFAVAPDDDSNPAGIGERLGVGLADLVGVLDPGVIVVGGSGAGPGELLPKPARRPLCRSLSGAASRNETPVLPARFGARGAWSERRSPRRRRYDRAE